jgi:hypothetical protein
MRRWIFAIGCLAALVTGLAARAHALGAAIQDVRESGGYVWIDLGLDDLFPPRVAQSLARGMPATLAVHAELWRRRGAWFDRLESSFEAPLKVRYDPWSDRWRLERRDAPTLVVGSLDSLRLALSRPLAVPVGRVGQMEPHARYYVSVSVTLKPLSVEDLEEGEGWLSGEVKSKRRSGFGIITSLPSSVFDAVRNFAGFGDERARTQSDDFVLADLFRR